MPRKKPDPPPERWWHPTADAGRLGREDYYHGIRLREGGVVVWVNDEAWLAMRQDIRNHSPGGAEWGYSGSGPAQLALAILAHALPWHPRSSPPPALYQRYKREVIASIDANDWIIFRRDVVRWYVSVRPEALPHLGPDGLIH